MDETKNKELKYCWLFDIHNKDNSNRSPWLQSTLAELEQKARAMLNIIQEDADSFAERAEMYYKKRPELNGLVEDLYRSHRSLAERYDRIKSEPPKTPPLSPPSSSKYSIEKPSRFTGKAYDCYSEVYEPEMSDLDESSEVDDPEEEQETLQDHCTSNGASNGELVMILREEVEKLREENRAQKEELKLKDEEKREVIRQLSLSVELHREEKVKLQQYLVMSKHQNEYDNNLKDGFLTRLAVPWICKNSMGKPA